MPAVHDTPAHEHTNTNTNNGHFIGRLCIAQNKPEPQYSGDSFYSHFPSYNNQNKQREQLVNNRHQDYRDHLSKVCDSFGVCVCVCAFLAR